MPFKPGQSGNPNGRPKGYTRQNMARDAVIAEYGSEKDFWSEMVTRSREDNALAKIIIDRLQPAYKPTAAPVHVELPEDATTAEAVPLVVQGIAKGEIPVDEGANLLSALLAGSKLEKLEALEAKVDSLLESRHGNY